MNSSIVSDPNVPLPTISEADAEGLLRRDRFDTVALIAKADHRFRAGDHRAAVAFYKTAVRSARQSDAPDPPLLALSERASRIADWLDRRFREHMMKGLTAAGFSPEKRHPRFQQALGILLGERQRDPVAEQYPQLPMAYFYPGLSYVDFANPADFPWRKSLEAKFPAMREEAQRLLNGGETFSPYVKGTSERPQGDVHGLLENPSWSTIHLWENGSPVPQHVALCPTIYKTVMDHVPLCHIGPRAPSVMLSLLKAGARIPPHTGMLNVRFICHFPLIVPLGCGFRVGSRSIEWQEGELILFDDTVEHEAWNNSSEDRLVLIFDVWRPELSEDERTMIKVMFQIIDSY